MECEIFRIILKHVSDQLSVLFQFTWLYFKSLNNILSRQALLTTYKSFIRPRLDYGDVIYDQPNNKSFCQTTESIHYKAALAITGARKGTSQAKFYKELGLETLKFRK